MNKKDFVEEQLRILFSEEFNDVAPPQNFAEEVMQQVKKSASPPEAFSNKIAKACLEIWNSWSKPRTISFSPLRVAVCFCLIFCSMLAVHPSFLNEERSEQSVMSASLRKQGVKPVTFALPDPQKRYSSAVVIGSFNKWQSRGFEMSYDESQEAWVLEHELPAGDYEYVFFVDGTVPMPDPSSVFYVQDSFGNKNSLLHVGGALHEL
jgi:hypothetical protein